MRIACTTTTTTGLATKSNVISSKRPQLKEKTKLREEWMKGRGHVFVVSLHFSRGEKKQSSRSRSSLKRRGPCFVFGLFQQMASLRWPGNDFKVEIRNLLRNSTNGSEVFDVWRRGIFVGWFFDVNVVIAATTVVWTSCVLFFIEVPLQMEPRSLPIW